MIGERYGKALFHVAKEQDTLKSWLVDLEVLKQHPKILHYFASPITPLKDKEAILTKCFGKSLLVNFILVLLKRRRFNYFSSIVDSYKKFAYEALGIAEGTLTTPLPLEANLKKQLLDRWESYFKKQILLTEQVDKALIGGGILTIQDKRIDFSLKGKLERLKQTIG